MRWQRGGCAHLSRTTPLLQPGHILAGRFQLVRCLGRGGMGEVYEAVDLREHQRPVAVKIILAGIGENAQNAGTVPA